MPPDSPFPFPEPGTKLSQSWGSLVAAFKLCLHAPYSHRDPLTSHTAPWVGGLLDVHLPRHPCPQFQTKPSPLRRPQFLSHKLPLSLRVLENQSELLYLLTSALFKDIEGVFWSTELGGRAWSLLHVNPPVVSAQHPLPFHPP